MLENLDWVRTIFFDYPILKYLIVFLGTGLGGEIFLVTFAFLAAQGVVSLYALVPLSFLGTYCSDTIWFLLGRTKKFVSMTTHRYASPTVAVITQAVHRMTRGNHFAALVFAKFLFGTRIITILYISKTHLTLKKFLHYNSYAVFFWVLVVIPIGYSSGLGYVYLSQVFESFYASLGFLLMMVLLIILAQVGLKHFLTKKSGEKFANKEEKN